METIDIIGGIECAAAAAAIIIVLSQMLGASLARQWKVAAALSAWFGIVVALAATGALHERPRIGSAAVGVAVLAPIVLMCTALRRVGSLREAMTKAPLENLVALHSVRVLGVSFLILQADGRLPAPFAPLAGGGDVIAGLAAIFVAWMIHRRAAGWQAALMAWNLFGLADLTVAIALGVLSSRGPLRMIFTEPSADLMSTLPWLLIPAYLVPLLATIHLVIFSRISAPCRAGCSTSSAAR